MCQNALIFQCLLPWQNKCWYNQAAGWCACRPVQFRHDWTANQYGVPEQELWTHQVTSTVILSRNPLLYLPATQNSFWQQSMSNGLLETGPWERQPAVPVSITSTVSNWSSGGWTEGQNLITLSWDRRVLFHAKVKILNTYPSNGLSLQFSAFLRIFWAFKCCDIFIFASKWGLNLGVYCEATEKNK